MFIVEIYDKLVLKYFSLQISYVSWPLQTLHRMATMARHLLKRHRLARNTANLSEGVCNNLFEGPRRLWR